MDYQTKHGFKPTTNGRELLTACAATGKGLNISRVSVGNGRVPVDVDLADVHELYNYVADGAISRRSHENDRLYLTVQYANSMDQTLPTFYIAEYMVYAIHPETNEETDLLYGTLGSYLQPVPAYDAGQPVSTFDFPMFLVVSDDIEVTVTAQGGLVTYDELQAAVDDAVTEIRETAEQALERADQGITRINDYVVISDTPPASGPALWFCSDRTWRPAHDRVATAVLGDPALADEYAVTGEVNDVIYPVINASVSEEDGTVVATIEQ